MANDIWFISDTHFNHANILTFRHKNETGELIRPGFTNVEHMNEVMIENWNKNIKPQDKVYHLGDVAFGNVKDFHRIMSRLNGQLRLVMGNHDKFDMDYYLRFNRIIDADDSNLNYKYEFVRPNGSSRIFEKVMSWRQFRNMPIPFVACHYPLHEDSLYGRNGLIFNVHGHIHERRVKLGNKIDPRYINVSVEQTNYAPIHMDELQARMKKLT